MGKSAVLDGRNCILNLKTTWSDIQKPSQTTNEPGEAKLCIFNFKTTWSEFQKPSSTYILLTPRLKGIESFS